MPLPTTPEILFGASASGGAVIVGWFARRILAIDRRTERISQTLHGDPESREPDGVVHRQNKNIAAINDMDHRVENLEGRVERVEQTCVALHGPVIVRPQE